VDHTQCKVPFKIKVIGVPFYDQTTADGEFHIEKWDKSPGGFMDFRADLRTYDLPIYSSCFVMREAWLVMENPDNAQ
jgi:hypothetical protein